MKKDERSPRQAASRDPGTTVPAEGPSFEETVKRLGEIVEQLESGEKPLDESLRLFEEGVELSKRASSLLDQAERKVEALTRVSDGTLRAAPFHLDPGEEE